MIDTTIGLVTLEQVKDFLGIDTTDTQYDTRLDLFINAASSYMESYTGRGLKQRTATEYYDGDGKDYLFFNNYPVTPSGVVSLYDDADRVYGADTLIASGDYCVSIDGTKLMYDTYFTSYNNNVKLTYVGGYAATDRQMYDLQLICLEIIQYWWEMQQNQKRGVTTRTIGDGQVSVETNKIPSDITVKLEQYRRIW